MILNLKLRRIITLFLLPIVIIGLYYVYKHNRVNEIYATDPLKITMEGVGELHGPMFDLNDLKPGDSGQKCFKVENASGQMIPVEMTGYKSLEEKEFSRILDITIIKTTTSDVIFSGKLNDFLDNPLFKLGDYEIDEIRNYCINYSFPKEAGNEYQEAKVVFDIVWRTEIPEDDIPPECDHLRNQFVKILYGTNGIDLFDLRFENEGSYLVITYDGSDIIKTGSYDDCIVAGDGSDYIISGSGNDFVFGGNGVNTIETNDGDDMVWGGDDLDKIILGGGNDIAYGGGGKDDIKGGDGNDVLYGGMGDDFIDGQNGNDKIYGGNGNDLLYGGFGMDLIYGEDGNDTIKGEGNDDQLDGGEGTDVIFGGNGTDTCVNGETYSSCEI